jgi:hypothetical protein
MAPVPTLLVKWEDEPVGEGDYQACLPSSAAWTSREHRCSHSFGLALEPEAGSGAGAGAGRHVVQSSAALRAEHSDFLPNTIISDKLSATTSRSFCLYCVDPDRALAISRKVKGVVSTGLPAAVRLFSRSAMPLAEVCGREALFDVPFHSKFKMSDLEVLLVDSCGNIINMKKLTDRVKDLEVKVSVFNIEDS